MLKIRLKRVGRRNDPAFRIVVIDSHAGPKAGKDVERVGFYHPKTKEQEIDKERVEYWMSVGAQPSDTVYNMLVAARIIDGKKKNVLPKKSPVVKEVEEEAAEEKAEEPASDDAPADDAGEGEEKEEKPAEAEAPAEEDKKPEEEKAEEKAEKEEPAEAEEEKK